MATLIIENPTTNSAKATLTNYNSYTIQDPEHKKGNGWYIEFTTNVGTGAKVGTKNILEEEVLPNPLTLTLYPLLWNTEHLITAKVYRKLLYSEKETEKTYDEVLGTLGVNLIQSCSNQWEILEQSILGQSSSQFTPLQERWHQLACDLREYVYGNPVQVIPPLPVIEGHEYVTPTLANEYLNLWNIEAIKWSTSSTNELANSTTTSITTLLPQISDLPYWSWTTQTGLNATSAQLRKAYAALNDPGGHAIFAKIEWEVWYDLIDRINKVRELMGMPINIPQTVTESNKPLTASEFNSAVNAIMYPTWTWRDEPGTEGYIGRLGFRQYDIVHEIYILQLAKNLNVLIKIALDNPANPKLFINLFKHLAFNFGLRKAASEPLNLFTFTSLTFLSNLIEDQSCFIDTDLLIEIFSELYLLVQQSKILSVEPSVLISSFSELSFSNERFLNGLFESFFTFYANFIIENPVLLKNLSDLISVNLIGNFAYGQPLHISEGTASILEEINSKLTPGIPSGLLGSKELYSNITLLLETLNSNVDLFGDIYSFIYPYLELIIKGSEDLINLKVNTLQDLNLITILRTCLINFLKNHSVFSLSTLSSIIVFNGELIKVIIEENLKILSKIDKGIVINNISNQVLDFYKISNIIVLIVNLIRARVLFVLKNYDKVNIGTGINNIGKYNYIFSHFSNIETGELIRVYILLSLTYKYFSLINTGNSNLIFSFIKNILDIFCFINKGFSSLLINHTKNILLQNNNLNIYSSLLMPIVQNSLFIDNNIILNIEEMMAYLQTLTIENISSQQTLNRNDRRRWKTPQQFDQDIYLRQTVYAKQNGTNLEVK